MAAPPLPLTVQMLNTADHQLDDLNLGTSGSRHQNIARALDGARKLLEQVTADASRPMDEATLEAGIVIKEALRAAGLTGRIREVTRPNPNSASLREQRGAFRVILGGDLPDLIGTKEQIVALLAFRTAPVITATIEEQATPAPPQAAVPAVATPDSGTVDRPR